MATVYPITYSAIPCGTRDRGSPTKLLNVVTAPSFESLFL